jgi:hypothetical protein
MAKLTDGWSYPIERVADWVKRPSIARALTYQDLLMLVRPADCIRDAGRSDSRPWTVYCWDRSLLYCRVSLGVNEDGSLHSFWMPFWIAGASLEFVRDRFSDPEWRRSMDMERENLNEVVAAQIEAAYRARQKHHAEIYDYPKF